MSTPVTTVASSPPPTVANEWTTRAGPERSGQEKAEPSKTPLVPPLPLGKLWSRATVCDKIQTLEALVDDLEDGRKEDRELFRSTVDRIQQEVCELRTGVTILKERPPTSPRNRSESVPVPTPHVVRTYSEARGRWSARKQDTSHRGRAPFLVCAARSLSRNGETRGRSVCSTQQKDSSLLLPPVRDRKTYTLTPIKINRVLTKYERPTKVWRRIFAKAGVEAEMIWHCEVNALEILVPTEQVATAMECLSHLGAGAEYSEPYKRRHGDRVPLAPEIVFANAKNRLNAIPYRWEESARLYLMVSAAEALKHLPRGRTKELTTLLNQAACDHGLENWKDSIDFFAHNKASSPTGTKQP